MYMQLLRPHVSVADGAMVRSVGIAGDNTVISIGHVSIGAMAGTAKAEYANDGVDKLMHAFCSTRV